MDVKSESNAGDGSVRLYGTCEYCLKIGVWKVIINVYYTKCKCGEA